MVNKIFIDLLDLYRIHLDIGLKVGEQGPRGILHLHPTTLHPDFYLGVEGGDSDILSFNGQFCNVSSYLSSSIFLSLDGLDRCVKIICFFRVYHFSLCSFPEIYKRDHDSKKGPTTQLKSVGRVIRGCLLNRSSRCMTLEFNKGGVIIQIILKPVFIHFALDVLHIVNVHDVLHLLVDLDVHGVLDLLVVLDILGGLGRSWLLLVLYLILLAFF